MTLSTPHSILIASILVIAPCQGSTNVLVEVAKIQKGSQQSDGQGYLNQYIPESNGQSQVTLTLKDSLQHETPYSLQIVKSTGNWFDTTTKTVTSEAGKPDYYPYFQNEQAMQEVISAVGEFNPLALSVFTNPGAANSTTQSIQISGFTQGTSVTFFFFVGAVSDSGVHPTSAPTVTGGTGTFAYATTSGSGFQNSVSYSTELTALTLIQWEGTVNAEQITFSPGGTKLGVAAMFFSIPAPEPATAALSLLGFAGLSARRRRTA